MRKGVLILLGAAALIFAGVSNSIHTAPSSSDGAPFAVDAGYEILDALEIEDPQIAVSVRAGRGGHYYLKAQVNGRSVPFLVDTGASYVTLNYRDARKVGLTLPRSAFRHAVSTANGSARVAAVRLRSIRYKSLHVKDVVALVTQRGAMKGMNLLGNSFLSRLRTFKVRNGKLIMR